jgi:hypothetical protein
MRRNFLVGAAVVAVAGLLVGSATIHAKPPSGNGGKPSGGISSKPLGGIASKPSGGISSKPLGGISNKPLGNVGQQGGQNGKPVGQVNKQGGQIGKQGGQIGNVGKNVPKNGNFAQKGQSFNKNLNFKNYCGDFGKKCSFGYCYYGNSHCHWQYCCYWPQYSCQCYYCPSAYCWYYWCEPRCCYLPVSCITYAPPVQQVVSQPVINVSASGAGPATSVVAPADLPPALPSGPGMGAGPVQPFMP